MIFSFFIIKTERGYGGGGGPQKTTLNNMMISTGILIYELPRSWTFTQLILKCLKHKIFNILELSLSSKQKRSMQAENGFEWHDDNYGYQIYE